MSGDKQQPGKDTDRKAVRQPPGKPIGQPAWSDGLRKLYDEVVDEPLPESFKDLLEKLDDPTDRGSA